MNRKLIWLDTIRRTEEEERLKKQQQLEEERQVLSPNKEFDIQYPYIQHHIETNKIYGSIL